MWGGREVAPTPQLKSTYNIQEVSHLTPRRDDGKLPQVSTTDAMVVAAHMAGLTKKPATIQIRIAAGNRVFTRILLISQIV